MLKNIFSFASFAVLHTGVVTGIAYVQGGHSSPLTTGAASFGCGVLGIVFGSFAGHHFHDRHQPVDKAKGATILGLTGYAIGSATGYLIR